MSKSVPFHWNTETIKKWQNLWSPITNDELTCTYRKCVSATNPFCFVCKNGALKLVGRKCRRHEFLLCKCKKLKIMMMLLHCILSLKIPFLTSVSYHFKTEKACFLGRFCRYVPLRPRSTERLTSKAFLYNQSRILTALCVFKALDKN